MTPLEMKALFVGVCVVAGIALWLAWAVIWARRKRARGRSESALLPAYYRPPRLYDWAKREPMVWGRS